MRLIQAKVLILKSHMEVVSFFILNEVYHTKQDLSIGHYSDSVADYVADRRKNDYAPFPDVVK